MWYVVNVATGAEEKAAADINRLVGGEILKECFNPRYEVQKHLRGAWRTVEQPLFPGYVIADTQRPDDLADALRDVPGFTRLLGNGETYVPLERAEMEWISAFTQEGRRVIGMSTGVIEGDQVVILTGPLMNRTASITSINRRKRLAYLKLDLCGRTVSVKVGLGIIRKTL